MQPANGKKTSRPPFQPTDKSRDQVQSLKGLMVSEAAIANFLDIDVKTLKRHFRTQLDHGHDRTVARLKAVIF